jgi:hypothetical protein
MSIMWIWIQHGCHIFHNLVTWILIREGMSAWIHGTEFDSKLIDYIFDILDFFKSFLNVFYLSVSDL